MEGRKKKFIKELMVKPKLRRESGLYLVDGPKMACEIPAEDVEEVYVTSDFLRSPHAAFCQSLLAHTGYTEITESEMKQISDTVTPQGVLIVARQKRLRGLSALLSAAGEKPLLLILETIQDPGNLGTILRASEAAGVNGVLMNRGCADIYAPKVVRSTMGAIFRVPFLAVENLCTAVQSLKNGVGENGKMNVYAAHLKSAVDYTKADFTGGAAVMIGNESKGLSEELCAYADQMIKIPMAGKVESLNAAMAAAIIAFEAARQRRQ